MSSDRKIEANRRNAQKSTGPRTLTGKAIACMNALKHGLCARKPVVPGEDEAEYARFAAELVDHFRPDNPVRAIQVEQFIVAAWQLRRVPQIRAGLIAEQMRIEAASSEPTHPFTMRHEGYVELSRIDRHQQTLERTMNKALKDVTTDYTDYTDEGRLETRGYRLEEEQEVQNEPTGEELPQLVGVGREGPDSGIQPQASRL